MKDTEGIFIVNDIIEQIKGNSSDTPLQLHEPQQHNIITASATASLPSSSSSAMKVNNLLN
jgi:hypothetical protein